MPEVSIKRKELKSLPLPDGASSEETSSGINNKLQSETEGNLLKLQITDNEAQNYLNDILKELKIMNLHLAIITGTHITRQDVE